MSPRIATDPKPGILSAHDVIATDIAILIYALVVASPLPSESVLAAESGLGGDSIGKFWLEFSLEKSLELWLEIPYTKKTFKNG